MNEEQHQKSLKIAIIGGLGVVLFIAILVSGGSSLPENSGGLIYEYQTLIGAFIAAGSIYMTWFQYRKTTKSKEFSARAHMNDALSAICKYSKDCFLSTYDNREETVEKPTEAINTLKQSIQYLDSESAESVYQLVGFYQVYNARREPRTSDHIVMIDQRESALYDSVQLSALSIRLFDFARNRVEKISFNKPTSNDLKRSLKNITFTRDDMYSIYEDQDIKKVLDTIDRRDSS